MWQMMELGIKGGGTCFRLPVRLNMRWLATADDAVPSID